MPSVVDWHPRLLFILYARRCKIRSITFYVRGPTIPDMDWYIQRSCKSEDENCSYGIVIFGWYEKTDYSSWRRLERVIESSGLTINSFARYVGLPRGENLYQIKRGNYGVSLGVAKRSMQISAVSDFLVDARRSRIRCYAGRRCFRRSDPCISGLFRGGVSAQGGSRTVSASFCRRGSGGSNCIMHGRSIRNGLQHWLVLLREPDGEVINGRVYFVMTECFYLFCSVYRIEGDPARLRLKSLFATADDDLEVRCEEICVMWPVCGAICGLK